MAITPNVSGEQSVKQSIRGQVFGGANTWALNPPYNVAVNALDTNYNTKLFDFVALASGTYVVSGINSTTTVTGSVTGTATVSGLVTALQAVAPAGTLISTPRKPTDFLYKTTTQLYITATGGTIPTLAITSGTSVASVTQITGNLTVMSAAFPNYYGTPNAAPSWVDDATAHAYALNGVGAVTQDTTTVVQKQVRQIKTDPAETQILDGYFAAYQLNLNQTEQKNTKQQQC